MTFQTASEEFAEELLCSLLVPTTLDKNIQDVAVLIDRPPPGVPFTIERQKHLSQMPCVARPGTPTPELIHVLLATFAAPLADRFVGDDDRTDEQQFFHIAVAEREAEREPARVADDLTRKPVMFAEIRRG